MNNKFKLSVVYTLAFCFLFSIFVNINPMNFNREIVNNYSNSENVKHNDLIHLNGMVAAGMMTWSVFAVTAIPMVIIALLPGSAGFKLAADLSKPEKAGTIAAIFAETITPKLHSANMYDLAWTVVDLIIAFTPAGTVFKGGKLLLVGCKVVGAL